jgi:hypothetical protein
MGFGQSVDEGDSVSTGVVLGFVGGMIVDRVQQETMRQQQNDADWARANAEDAKIHADAAAGGFTAAHQHKHDCNYLAKVRALIQQMKNNRDHYLGFNSKFGDDQANNEQLEINFVSRTQLHEAELACAGK